MKVAIDWLRELVEINKPLPEFIHEINMKTIGTKEITEEFIELDMKGYNRADLLSLRGMAYEAAAILNSEVKFKEPQDADYVWVSRSLDKTPVSIESEEVCELQCVAKIEGLKVGKSSEEWVTKLKDSGMRSIDNITDVTNLIMLEYGQPLHSFDGATVADQTINVRFAKEGEEINTLDNKKRVLTSKDVVLADTEKALDVAGVMGGKDTEIKESTKTILLSASFFNPELVRATSGRLKLSSEASKRFYHGLTKNRLFQALDGAIRMYEGLGGKLTGLTIIGASDEELVKIPVSLKKINSLVGVEFKNTQVEDYLKALHFEVTRVDDFSWVVTPPYFRLDVLIEEDVVEEVARMYGYEKIPATELPGEKPTQSGDPIFELISRLKGKLVELGLTEVQTYSFFSTKVLNNFGMDRAKDLLVKLENPISAESEYMRIAGWPNLVETVSKNSKDFKDIAIFEVGKVYSKAEGEKPAESWVLSMALMNGTSEPLLELLRIFKELNFEVILNKTNPPVFMSHVLHSNKHIEFLKEGKQKGGAAEVHPRLLDAFSIKERVAILEIYLDNLSSN